MVVFVVMFHRLEKNTRMWQFQHWDAKNIYIYNYAVYKTSACILWWCRSWNVFILHFVETWEQDDFNGDI